MAHFAITSPNTQGPINTMMPLGQELLRRGHQVTLIGVPDMRKFAMDAGLGFSEVGTDRIPLNSSSSDLKKLSELKGMKALKYTVFLLERWAKVMLDEAPNILKEIGADAILANQGSVESGTVADAAGIPFYTISSAVPLNQEPDIPPVFTHWDYNPSSWGRLKNQMAYGIQRYFSRSLISMVVQYRAQYGLRKYQSVDEVFSPYLQLSQFPREYEFPRKNLPNWFHFTGPFHDERSRTKIEFEWSAIEELRGNKPMVYLSMGTLQNRLASVYECAAKACHSLGIPLVISTGGVQLETVKKLASEGTLVFDMVPQMSLLQQTDLMITHGGTNTTMECIKSMTPMLALPVTNDHPGNSARIRRSGIGEVIKLPQLNVSNLTNSIGSILENREKYLKNLEFLNASIHNAGGVKKAATLIEKSYCEQRPIERVDF